ncbi:MAG: tripartite tricarboxylate transporter substrate binding protein [Azoarcus sp.]|jgi:tripartite-type tricarboxylate transporter receptor subunit TctC|nr:tripartite tricarboxylate transporter substrate binding protein [Azoarcus sp.]
MKKILFAAIVLTALTCGFSGASAADYPNRPVKIVVPFPAGGPTDIVARPYAEALGESLHNPVIIENRGGAGGSIGATEVAKSTADGYTLLLGTVGTQAINEALYPKLAYDPAKDFRPVAILAAAPVALVAHPSVPANTVAELATLAKKRELRFGSAGNGTPGHLTGELFKSASGIALTHVPYKGSAPALQDLIGGHIELMFDPLQSVLAHIRAGKLKVIAISSAIPSPLLPQTPTFGASGVNVETTAWWGLFAPVATPDSIVARLAKEADSARKSAAVKQLENIGLVLQGTQTPEQQTKFLQDERAKWGKAVRDSGARVD